MPAMFAQQPPTQQTASTDLFGSLSTPNSKSVTPSPQQQQQAQKKPDPFAALSNSNSRSGSPFQFQSSRSPQSAPPPAQASSSFDLLGGSIPTAAPAPSNNNSANNDDEWTFSSALPDAPQDLTITNSAIKTIFAVTRPNNTELVVSSRISNNTTNPIEDLTFQLAVTKVR
jgi:ADP-ribosylation factor-binding protein GGA